MGSQCVWSWLEDEGGKRGRGLPDAQIPGSATYSDSEDRRGAAYLGKDGSDVVK